MRCLIRTILRVDLRRGLEEDSCAAMNEISYLMKLVTSKRLRGTPPTERVPGSETPCSCSVASLMEPANGYTKCLCISIVLPGLHGRKFSAHSQWCYVEAGDLLCLTDIEEGVPATWVHVEEAVSGTHHSL